MIFRLLIGAVWVLMVLFPATLSGRSNHVAEDTKSTDCRENGGDRRYMVCRGAWSGKTVALFNTWMAARFDSVICHLERVR